MTSSLQANIRNNVSRGENHRLRESGRIPAVIYGLNRQNFNVELAEAELFDILSAKGEHAILDVNINGSSEHAMIKEVQRHPITREIIHVDLQRVDENKKIHARVPVRIVGEEQARRNGGMTQKQVGEIEVMCTPEKLPRFITADVSQVRIGGRVTLGDLEIAEEISILGDPATVVVSLSHVKDMQTEAEDADAPMAIHTEEK